MAHRDGAMMANSAIYRYTAYAAGGAIASWLPLAVATVHDLPAMVAWPATLRDAGQARVQAVSGRQFPILRRCVVAAPELDLGAGGGR